MFAHLQQIPDSFALVHRTHSTQCNMTMGVSVTALARGKGDCSFTMGWSMRFFWLFLVVVVGQEDKTCAWNEGCTIPLEEMTVDLGHGNETAFVYVSPDVSTFYQEPPGSRTVQKPKFNGMFGKFINLSPESVRVWWVAGIGKENVYIADIGPFEAAATATFPSHQFVMCPKMDPSKELVRFRVVTDQTLYPYDPLDDDVSVLNDFQLKQYTLQKENLEFAAAYERKTGRGWLSLYRKRHPPRYHMWNANYFGQEHVVTTNETQFHSLPPNLAPIKSGQQRQLYEDYRTPLLLNLTLKVLSCEPRVFEIRNFLSDAEVDHILELAATMNLKLSTTRAGHDAEARSSEATRSSRNTWVSREKSPVIDTLYRRAADLLQMDEALLRRRLPDEDFNLKSKSSIAETLQLVHYAVGEQYTPHHDFSVPLVQNDLQPARFATILFYLNEGMEGGETSFPKWKNAETREKLVVKPEKGKAVLFYSILPDGNMDELSQHAAMPVKKGEKWLTNLWVWDPYM